MLKKILIVIQKYLPLTLVFFAIVFNIYTLYPELNTKADPNDNIFQYALVVRSNEVLQNCKEQKTFFLTCFMQTVDHWTPYWASGYPLPLYYQHLPHLSIVVIHNLLLNTLSLYQTFLWVKFLLWIIFPLSLFLCGRWFGFSLLQGALISFFGSQILTDGLYGVDISSFAFRGYGLSTQLFAIVFAPLALAKIYQIINNFLNPENQKPKTKDFFLAVLLLAATFASHMAIGYMVALSLLLVPLALFPFENYKINDLPKLTFIKPLFKAYFPLLLILVATFFLLSYWLVPLLLGNVYHNVSFWDPPVKWNSYGAKIIIAMFLNGELFDFSRPPILTLLVISGFFVSLFRFKGKYRFFSLAFPFWLVFFFGRTTFGSLIDLLPMMKEMHQQRLINGLQLISIPMIGIGAGFWLNKLRSFVEKIIILKKAKTKKLFTPLLNVFLALFILFSGFIVYKANLGYLKFNRDILKQSNDLYTQDENDFKQLVAKIHSLPPGRVFAGRPGNWGRQFQIGATQVYLALSTQDLDINGFLPESWSLNTDIETFFNEYNQDHYQFYNVRYLVTPNDFVLPPFAKEISVFGRFKLSEIPTSGYFDIGTSNLLVKAKKEEILNLQHLWFVSDLPFKKEFPSLWLKGVAPNLSYDTKIDLVGTNLYRKDNKENTLFSLSYPLTTHPESLGKIIKEEISGEIYQTTLEVDKECQDCLVIFKMTYHPNWQAKIDNQKTDKFMVLPSFMALKLTPGTHIVSFEYKPDLFKLPLLIVGIFFLFATEKLFKKIASQ